MDTTFKTDLRKRVVVGWRQLARRIAENRSRHATPPPPPSKRAR